MKKLILIMAVTAFCNLTVKAQDGERIFKRFKGEVSLGYAASLGSGSNGGVIFAMEPKFALMDKLSVGLRVEGAIMGKFTSTNQYGGAEIEDAKGVASYIATADYYFTTNYSFRPFVGGGAGVFGLIADATYYSDDVTETKFGGIVRVGGEVKHFRFGVEYNIIPVSNIASYDNMGNSIMVKSKNSYIGIKLGFCFGGGPL